MIWQSHIITLVCLLKLDIFLDTKFYIVVQIAIVPAQFDCKFNVKLNALLKVIFEYVLNICTLSFLLLFLVQTPRHDVCIEKMHSKHG